MEDQVFKNKPMEFYLNLSKEGVFSRSDIQLADVPAVFKAQVIDGIKDEKSNRAFDLGTAAHSALIELNTDIFLNPFFLKISYRLF